MTYYYSGLPYSDELYHHGIKGQKWGIRRFQNADGTLTTAGRARYYGSEATKKLGDYLSKATKKTAAVGKKVGGAVKNKLVTAIKKRHPSLMTDVELIEFKRRLDLERSYKDAVADMKSRKWSHKTVAAVEDILKRTGTKFGETLAQNAGQKIAAKMFESKSDKLKEKNKILKERTDLINNSRALADLSDRERNLRDTDAATRSRQLGDRFDRASSAANANADRLDRIVERRIERMENRSRMSSRNDAASGPQPARRAEDTTTFNVNGNTFRSRRRQRHQNNS